MSRTDFRKPAPKDSGFIVLWDEDRDLNLRLHLIDIKDLIVIRTKSVRIANAAIKKAMRAK